MFGKLLLLFIGVPLVEMFILIKMGEMMGFWPTVGLVVGTGFLGALLARVQGARAWTNVQRELARGELPASQLVDSLLILIAGIVLLTPGLLTDILGFLLLIPLTRNLFKAWIGRRLKKMATGHQGDVRSFLQ
ncbi:hypothetical protein BVX98_04690 [bacterium F11]|nr:hypothetical protein BVX98_04690 [bacterium F11]